MIKFSIIYETENLSSVEIENVYRSLDSISKQTISPKEANEFIIIDGGYATEEVMENLQQKYPWVKIHKQVGVKYYEGKMLGASLATGDIVLFLDSDCEYVPDLIEMILAYFEENPTLNVVSGEASTLIRNPYELAIACHYFFPRYSNGIKPYQTSRYFLNNVAFRRSFLLENPIPFYSASYRGNCSIHGNFISRELNEKIIVLPQNRTLHEPPQMKFIYWRYFLMGRDSIIKKNIMRYLEKNGEKSLKNFNKENYTSKKLLEDLDFNPFKEFLSSFLSFRPFKYKKVKSILKSDRKYIIWFLPAFFYIISFELTILFGKLISCFSPDLIFNQYQKKIKYF